MPQRTTVLKTNRVSGPVLKDWTRNGETRVQDSAYKVPHIGKGLVNSNVDALSRNPVVQDGDNIAELGRAQLYEQEQKNNALSGEKDHPPARVLKTRAKRVPNDDKILIKEKFDDKDGDSGSDTLRTPINKIRRRDAEANRAEEIKRKRTKDTSPCSICSSSDDDMGEKPPVRQAKLRAREKIFKIIQDGKRPHKKLEQTTHKQTAEVSNTIPPHSHEPEASTSAQHNEQETPAEESAEERLTTPTKTHTSEPARAVIEEIDLYEAQSLEWDAYLNDRPQLIETADSINDGFTRRSLGEIARDLSTKLLVDIKEGEKDGKHGLRIDIWEIEPDKQLAIDNNNPVPFDTVRGDTNSNHPLLEKDVHDIFNEYNQANNSLSPIHNDQSVPENANNDSDIISPLLHTPYTEHDTCAEPTAMLTRSDEIPTHPPGNCLFYSLIKICNLKISALQLRRELLESPFVASCGNPTEAVQILSSKSQFGDINCTHVFAHKYNRNAHIHLNTQGEKYIYCQIISGAHNPFIHLHLKDIHFTPYLPQGHSNLNIHAEQFSPKIHMHTNNTDNTMSQDKSASRNNSNKVTLTDLKEEKRENFGDPQGTMSRYTVEQVSDFQLCLSSGYPGTDPLIPPPV
ncbi:hypothetical protein TKK_0009825 [Trichogramma kaykai]